MKQIPGGRNGKKSKRKNEKNQNVNEEAIAKKIKNLTTSIQPKVTSLKLPSSRYTEIGKEMQRIDGKTLPITHPKNPP